MSSRLDPFFRVVFDQLNSQGLSYRFVCASLLEEGVTISPQALRSWHLRRGRKIAARSLQTMAPVRAPAPGVTPASAPIDGIVQKQEQARAAPVIHVSHSLSAGLTPLLAQIEEEERRLVLQTTHQNFFPVRRKPIIDSSEPPSSTTATPQTQKGNP